MPDQSAQISDVDLNPTPPAHVPGQCPMDALLKLLMGPWTTYIVWLLETQGPLRFGEIKARMPAISSKVLTERLRHLEAAHLISRDYRPTIPPMVSYALTPRGHELKGVLDGLSGVALRWQAEDAQRGAQVAS
jgi:DNA-binding HxlR family transcriptional regulator